MEQTYKAAFDRIQSSSGLRRAVEIDLRKLGNTFHLFATTHPRTSPLTLYTNDNGNDNNNVDKTDSNVITEHQMRNFLLGLDLELTEMEVEYVINKSKRDGLNINYPEFQTMYQMILQEALQVCVLDKSMLLLWLHFVLVCVCSYEYLYGFIH
jgi:hypothetical protein